MDAFDWSGSFEQTFCSTIEPWYSLCIQIVDGIRCFKRMSPQLMRQRYGQVKQTNKQTSFAFGLLWMSATARLAHLRVVAHEGHVFVVRRQVVIDGVSFILAIWGRKKKQNTKMINLMCSQTHTLTQTHTQTHRILFACGLLATDLRRGFGWWAPRTVQSAHCAGGPSPPTSPDTRYLWKKSHKHHVYWLTFYNQAMLGSAAARET